jgi:hypothetical protein
MQVGQRGEAATHFLRHLLDLLNQLAGFVADVGWLVGDILARPVLDLNEVNAGRADCEHVDLVGLLLAAVPGLSQNDLNRRPYLEVGSRADKEGELRILCGVTILKDSEIPPCGR